MRAIWLLVAVVLGAEPAAARVALIDHVWGPPREVVAGNRSRRAGSPIVLGTPRSPMRDLPRLTESERTATQQVADRSTGVARIAALEKLLGAIEHDFELADDGSEQLKQLAVRATAIVAEPTLDQYPHAAELLVRATAWTSWTDSTLTEKILARVVATFPTSPFATDAELTLASVAEGNKQFKQAHAHLAAVMASRRPSFVTFAKFRLAWLFHLEGDDKGALRALVDVAALAPDLRLAIADLSVTVYAKARMPAANARAFFTNLDDAHNTPDRLRALADEYAIDHRDADAVTVLRIAMSLDSDRAATCRDRADIVSSLATAPNRADTEVAVADLRTALEATGTACSADAQRAVFDVAAAWHRAVKRSQPRERARVARMWEQALAVAIDPDATGVALHNLLALRWEAAHNDRSVATWIAIAELADRAVAAGSHDERAARDAHANADALAKAAQPRR